MYRIRQIEEVDLQELALMEIEISKISFDDKAITDIEFHKKKIRKSMEKDNRGMLVLESDDKIVAWLWMEKKENFITNEIYINFKSFYVKEAIRGELEVDKLMDAGIAFSKKINAKYIVGKVNAENIAMRTLYKNSGFKPTHISMEMQL